jgi:hypothetical protein
MFPWLAPRSDNRDEAGAGFSLDLYLKHREYNALLGVVAMTAVLIVKRIVFRH